MADEVMRASTELDALVPELWSANFYPTLLESLPFNDIISRDYQNEIQELGDTVNISEFPQFDIAENIAEDQRVDADSLTVTKFQLVINRQTVKDYIVTSRALTQSIDSANALRDLAMHSIMKKMQQDIISDIVPNAAAPDHSIAYDSGTTLALADILEAKELLDAADVEDDGTRCMILDAPQWNDLFNITGFTSRDFIPAGSPITAGSFSTNLLGFRPKLTTEANNVSFLFHPRFMTLAVQENPAVEVFNLGVDGKRAQRVNVTTLWGDEQLSGLRVVTIS